jgi:S-adenosylmethionine uptake transporter
MRNALWMLIATGCFSLMALISKLQAAHFGVGDLLFLRLLFSSAWVVLLQARLKFSLRPDAALGHARRAAFGCLAMGAWYFTLGRLPMGVSVTLNYMSPLFLAMLLHWGADRPTRPGKAQTALLAAGFAGVVLMMNPFAAAPSASQWLAYGIGMSGAVFGAMAFKDVKALKQAGQSEWQMVFYFSLFGALFSLPFTRGLQLLNTGQGSDWAMLGLAGLLGSLGQLGVSKAFGRGDPMVPASVQYMSVVFALMLGWALFDERPDGPRLAGTVLVVATAIGTIALSQRASPNELRR